jgi:hypothetical protein
MVFDTQKRFRKYLFYFRGVDSWSEFEGSLCVVIFACVLTVLAQRTAVVDAWCLTFGEGE